MQPIILVALDVFCTMHLLSVCHFVLCIPNCKWVGHMAAVRQTRGTLGHLGS